MKKNLLIAALTVTTLLLVLFMPSSVQGADYSKTDPTNDVTKLSYNKGIQVSVTENVAKGDVDMTAIDINWSPSLTENSTIVVTYAGTPVVDEYHFLGIGINITVHLNASYYVQIGLSIAAGATFRSESNVDAFVLFGYGMYNQSGDPVIDEGSYFPVLIGLNIYNISYTVSGNSITYSFGFTDEDSELLDAIASPESTEFNDLTAFSYVSDTPYWSYLENDTSTVWFDVYPNDADSDGNGDGASGANTDTDATNDTDADNPLASLTPGFATPLTVVALLSIAAVPLIRKHQKRT